MNDPVSGPIAPCQLQDVGAVGGIVAVFRVACRHQVDVEHNVEYIKEYDTPGGEYRDFQCFRVPQCNALGSTTVRASS